MPDAYAKWEILSSLKKFRVAEFDQRVRVFTEFRNEKTVSAGACPGLSHAWIRRREAFPNESASARLKAINTVEAWQGGVVKTTGAFNSLEAGFMVYKGKAVSGPTYSNKVAKGMGLQVGSSHKLDASAAGAGKTLFDRLSRIGLFGLVMVTFSNHDVGHICAAYCGQSSGFLGLGSPRTTITIFDPNFGEFAFAADTADAFLDAWVKQFATYMSGATGATKELAVNEIEVMRIDNTMEIAIMSQQETAAFDKALAAGGGRGRR
jgi:hypothetical protein